MAAAAAALAAARDVVRATPLDRLAPADAREYLRLVREREDRKSVV